MRVRIAAMLRKEARSLFASPIAWVVLTVYVSLTGVYFFQHLVSYNQLLFVYAAEGLGGSGFDRGTIPSQINILNELFVPASNDFSLFLLAVLPLITMRVFAEERSNGTDELLRTVPLRSWEIVAAKHGATYAFVALLLAMSAVYPAVAVHQSGLGLPHLAALYSGQLAYGIALAAIGLACSSLTQSQIVAAILAYAIPFVLLDFSWLSNSVEEATAAFLASLAIMPHFEGFARGVIDLRHLLYFASLVTLGLGVSAGSLELGRAR